MSQETARRKCLSLQQNYARKHTKEGYRKVAEKFGIGRTQSQKILKDREEILAQYESDMQLTKKRFCTAKYSDVNEAWWK